MTPTSNSVREYVRGERLRRRISQKELAKYMGFSMRAYTDWERGRTKTIKNHLLKKALIYLQTPSSVIARLMGNLESEEAIGEISSQIERLPPEEQEARKRQAVELIDELLADPKKLDKWIGYGERLREE